MNDTDEHPIKKSEVEFLKYAYSVIKDRGEQLDSYFKYELLQVHAMLMSSIYLNRADLIEKAGLSKDFTFMIENELERLGHSFIVCKAFRRVFLVSTYVTSDLHGYPLVKIQRKLCELNFNEKDHMYVLGDCIDRGLDGLQILRWIMSQHNITLLLGNHEAMLLDNHFLFEGDSIPAVLDLKGEQRNSYCVWTSNGGYATIDAMQQFSDAQIKHIFRFLEKVPLYKEIEVNGKKYILTHSGLGSFDANKSLFEYTRFDLVWSRPSLNTRYYKDGRKVIFGHTPTFIFGLEYKGKPIFTDTWIDIDTGAGIGMNPALLRLDDLKVFYF